MPIKVKHEERWKCRSCEELYSSLELAQACEDAHKIIYIPFKEEDLFHLLQYLYTKDEALLSESLMKTLLKYTTKL